MILWTSNGTVHAGDGYGDSYTYLVENAKKYNNQIISSKISQPNFLEELKGLNVGYFMLDKSIEDAEIIVNNCTPEAFIKGKGYSIGFTYWETNKLKDDWVRDMNKMDEIWTTSQSMVNIFINSGVTVPVYKFNLGVNEKLFFPKKRTLGDKVTFLCIGSPSTRKNSQTSVDAFLKLFDGDERYQMIYKSAGAPDARIYKNDQVFKLDHPQIKVIDYSVSEKELADIYDLCDCVLYPTSGEGWGLLPFQGIAKGIPTICTNATACTEYAEMSVSLDFEWSDYNMNGVYDGAGMWAKPNFDDLCDKMLYVVNNYEEVSNKTFASAQYIHENMTWDKVSKDYVDRLWQILKYLKVKPS